MKHNKDFGEKWPELLGSTQPAEPMVELTYAQVYGITLFSLCHVKMP